MTEDPPTEPSRPVSSWARSPLGITVIGALITTVGGGAAAITAAAIAAGGPSASPPAVPVPVMSSSTRSPTASPSPSTAIDSCLVGTWKGVAFTQTAQADKTTTSLTLKSGDGFLMIFTVDGRATQSYGSRPVLAGSANGWDITLTMSGTADFSYAGANGRLVFKGVSGSVSDELKEHYDGGFFGDGYDLTSHQDYPMAGITTTSEYTCDPKRLVLFTGDSRREYQRV